ncbi:MAG: glucosaminidase domain-containing protein [Bacteroidia bacterium]|nr:glucosaminidase domain-containing protein [Bacteroidia bacterium]
MRRVILSLAALAAIVILFCSADDTPQQRYIDKWAATAVREMYRSGVPASITLAQGLLESRYGQSELAAKGNNHFGIKCHSDWKGKTMKVDDDKKGECFRVYSDADDSFRDHSDFLRYKDRYKFLFDFDTKDYESWAYGLKKAGYATDPAYPAKLIKLIEDYNLSKYDSMTQEQAGKASAKAQKAGNKPEAETGTISGGKSEDKAPARDRKAERKARKVQTEVIPDEIPQSPNTIEQARQLTRTASEEFRFSLSREVLTINGVPFVYSIEGETYESIAASNNLFPKEILAINDLKKDQRLLPGTVVYLQIKKKQAEKGLDKYIVEEDGESLRDICQRFAVRQKSIEKLNGFSAGHVLREGDTIILRKQ